MSPVSMIAVLSAVAWVGLLCGAATAWCLSLYHLLRLAVCWRRAPRAGTAARLWAGADLPGDATYHRRRLLSGVRLLAGCLLGALLVHGLGALVDAIGAWVSGT